MGFQYAGNIGGAGASTVMNMYTGETCYVGQLLQYDMSGTAGGHVIPANAASEANEDDQAIIGVCSGIVDASRTYVAAASGTAQYGDRTTYTTSQTTVASTGASEVQVTVSIPMVTMFRAPIFNAAWGTALTEMVNTTASSGGVTITAANDAITDAADDFSTIYCRSGANRGLSRVVTTGTSTTVRTCVVPFPNAIAVGDVFVSCSLVKGFSHMDIPATADCIDGNNDVNAWYNVFVHQLNLEESGKEFAVFSFWNNQHVHT
jgi:hypothetical protein